MATALRHRKAQDFDIHEDGPHTEDTEMNTDAVGDEAEVEEEEEDGEEQHDNHGHRQKRSYRSVAQPRQEDQDQEAEDGDEAEADMSDEEVLDDDMRKLQDAFPGFKHKYRLIKRIGEGELDRSFPHVRLLTLVLLSALLAVVFASSRAMLTLNSCRHILHSVQG